MTRAALLSIALLLAACSDPEVAVVPVPAPDVSTLAPSVRNRVGTARAEFDRIAAGKPRNVALGNAYGDLGMAYHAQDMVGAAEAAYRNAHALAPREKRWPYLLGHLYADSSRIPEAIAQFEAVLAIDAADTPAQVYLGQLLVQQGELERARNLFEQAMQKPPALAAAHTGLGKVALAQQKYADAAQHFEKALELSPASSRLRQPLAAAYRGLGDSAKAQQALRGYSPAGLEPGLPDPVVDLLADKVASPHVLISRGKRYGQAGRFDLAEPAFRVAVEGDPKNSEALANLGISLANLNRDEEARKYLEQAVAIDADDIAARFSLAVVQERLRHEDLAVPQYEAALAKDPAHLQALAQLADLKLRNGQADAAAKLYRRASEKSPESPRFLFSHAMASVKAGRYADARASLETLTQRDKDPVFRNAFAKVLATAPEAGTRDGKRALAIARELFTETQRNADVAQTLAMALAESGDFDEAVKVQEGALASFRQTGPAWLVPLLERNLALYREKKPSREGWVAEDPVFQPRSPAVRPNPTKPS
jgi:tetratricopeptide (TPR) repeat protein